MDVFLAELNLHWQAIVAFFAVDTERLTDPDIMIRLAIQVGLLICSAFFSGSETALFSLSRLDLERLRKKKHPQSENLHELLDQPRRLIISILCGNELVNIAAAVNMTGLLLALYGESKAGLISILVMVPLILLFGEVTPKTIAVANPVRVSSSIVAYPISIWVKLVTPVRWAIRGISDRITTLFVGQEKAADNILQIDEFKSLVEEVADEGELDATERALIYNLLESGDTEIVEIMTPRTRVKFVNADQSVPEIVDLIREFRHPRVPVFLHHRDNIIGFIHAEDILRLILDKADTSALKLEQIIHPPVVVPLTKKVDEMFDFFQANQARAAAVLNEFGGVEGFLTMKDVLTFIFGQISDDITGSELYRERDENSYIVPGEMKLNDFNNLTNFGIEDPRMTTIGGVAFRHLDHLPVEGDRVKVEGISITVLEMDVHRIAKVRVSKSGSVDATSAPVDAPAATEEAEVDEKEKDKQAEPQQVVAEKKNARVKKTDKNTSEEGKTETIEDNQLASAKTTESKADNKAAKSKIEQGRAESPVNSDATELSLTDASLPDSQRFDNQPINTRAESVDNSGSGTVVSAREKTPNAVSASADSENSSTLDRYQGAESKTASISKDKTVSIPGIENSKDVQAAFVADDKMEGKFDSGVKSKADSHDVSAVPLKGRVFPAKDKEGICGKEGIESRVNANKVKEKSTNSEGSSKKTRGESAVNESTRTSAEAKAISTTEADNKTGIDANKKSELKKVKLKTQGDDQSERPKKIVADGEKSSGELPPKTPKSKRKDALAGKEE